MASRDESEHALYHLAGRFADEKRFLVLGLVESAGLKVRMDRVDGISPAYYSYSGC
jgi:hypothetical protein